MTKYVCFLRGINVGGHKLIKMNALNKMFVSLKFKNVSTYIQSGNILFETNESDKDVLQKKIQDKLMKTFGFEVEVFLRTLKNMEKIIRNNPFKDNMAMDNFRLYVSFLNKKPNKSLKEHLESLSNKHELFRIINMELYSFVDKSKLNKKIKYSTNFIEKILDTPATTRDWNTLNKILSVSLNI